MTTYQFRQLGSSGPKVFPLGLGCMGMSDMYGPADEAESIATTLVPLIGARTRTQFAESLATLQMTLTSADVDRIEAALPPTAVAGTRYDEHQMRVLDSER
jgi:aryl-alcohol dehydrogenase-like predicted oxidoreductase